MIWVLSLLPAGLVSLQATAMLPLVWHTVPLDGFQKVEGFAYSAPLDTRRFPPSDNAPETLLEDGRPSAYPPALGWDVVSTEGQGRFHVGAGAVYISASDNSDPRTNGRRYEIERPRPVRLRWFAAAWLLTLVLVAPQALRDRRPILAFLSAPPFWFVAAVMFGIMLANRLWLFVDYPMVAIHPDSGGYYAAAEMMFSGTLPNFGMRPPVYPIFMRIAFLIFDRAIFLSFCQTAVGLGAAMLVAYGAGQWKRSLALPAGLWMCLYLCSVTAMEHDSAMLSESLYATCLMFSFGALLIALRRLSATWLALASTGFALAMLTRPAGSFLVVSFLFVLAWLVFRRAGRAAVIAFMLPMPILLIAMSVYNQMTLRAFAPTTWGEANLAVATFLYWEQDPSYPPEINHDIREIREIIANRYVVTGLDRSLLDQTWEFERLAPIFVQSFNGAALDVAMRMGGNYDAGARPWIRRIAFDSIGKHPDYYAKFLSSMLYLYFKPASDFDFRAYLLNRAHTLYVEKLFSPERGNAFMVRMGKEFAAAVPPKRVIIVDHDPKSPKALQDRILLPVTPLWRVYHVTHVVRRALATNWYWSIGYFIMLIASTFVLLKARCRHDGAFMVFIITISAFGAALVVSMVEYSQPRYSHPMEWTYGLSLVLVPLLWMRSRPERAAAP